MVDARGWGIAAVKFDSAPKDGSVLLVITVIAALGDDVVVIRRGHCDGTSVFPGDVTHTLSNDVTHTPSDDVTVVIQVSVLGLRSVFPASVVGVCLVTWLSSPLIYNHEQSRIISPLRATSVVL